MKSTNELAPVLPVDVIKSSNGMRDLNFNVFASHYILRNLVLKCIVVIILLSHAAQVD